MEGGLDVDVEERTSVDAVPQSEEQKPGTREQQGDDNKFQKAIGAWRGTTTHSDLPGRG